MFIDSSMPTHNEPSSSFTPPPWAGTGHSPEPAKTTDTEIAKPSSGDLALIQNASHNVLESVLPTPNSGNAVDPNTTALCDAASRGQSHSVFFWAAKGANLTARDSEGHTAFHYAAINATSDLMTIDMFLELGVDIDVR
mgnify:CR=1 FL=1